jgi:hypothetical protein
MWELANRSANSISAPNQPQAEYLNAGSKNAASTQMTSPIGIW